MQDPFIPLYIAPYKNPFQFTVPRTLGHPALETRLSSFISNLAAERPQSKASVDKEWVPQPEGWVLLDLKRGTLVHSSFTTAYLIKSVRLEPDNQEGRIALPTIATLATPRLQTTDGQTSSRASDPLLTMLHMVLSSSGEPPKGIWKDYLEKSAVGQHDKYEPANVERKNHGRSVQQQVINYSRLILWPPEWSFINTDEKYPGNNWGITTYYHLCLWLPGASFPWDVFVPADTSPHARVTGLLGSVLREWTAAEGGKPPLVAEQGYYPTGNSWILVDFGKSPPIFVHNTDVAYMTFGGGRTMSYIVLPLKHGELVPAMKKVLETEGPFGWKKYWQNKLRSK